MKEKILEYIRKNPRSRQREIASALKVWLCNKDFLDALFELEVEDKIYRCTYQDMANMEFYNEWYANE